MSPGVCSWCLRPSCTPELPSSLWAERRSALAASCVHSPISASLVSAQHPPLSVLTFSPCLYLSQKRVFMLLMVFFVS